MLPPREHHEESDAQDDSYQRQDQKAPESYHNNFEFSETRKVLEEFFDPHQHQELQQQKLLEFQQRSKRQQVEKVLPLDDLVNFDGNAPQASATYIGQRLAALKQIQQKQHYQHQLQQQYENRSMIEEACASEITKPVLQLHENVIAEEDLDHNFHSYNQNNFSMSPEITDYESNCEDLDSDFSLRYSSLANDSNGIEPGRSFRDSSSLAMPVLEDGLSSEHGSDTENNNVDSLSIMELNSAQNNFKQLATDSNIERTSPTLDETKSNNNIYTSKESVSSGNGAESKPKDDEEADTDLETDRLLGQQRMAELEDKVEIKQENSKFL